MRIRNNARIHGSFLFFAGSMIFGCFTLSAATTKGNRKDVLPSSASESEIRRIDSPALYQRQHYSNSVKLSKKDSEPPFPQAGPSARQSSMIQAFGMPKRILDSDEGEIERVNLDRVSGLDGKIDKVNFARNDEAGIGAHVMPKRESMADNGVIERGENFRHVPKTSFRIATVTETANKNEDEFLEDLAAQEAKIFRPLFVYRQQLADRYRVDRRQNPIYGAYQYGRNKQRNFRHGYNY